MNNIVNTLILIARFKTDSSWVDVPLMNATKKNLGTWIDLLKSADYRREYVIEMGIPSVTPLAAHMLYFKKPNTSGVVSEDKNELKSSAGAAVVSDNMKI